METAGFAIRYAVKEKIGAQKKRMVVAMRFELSKRSFYFCPPAKVPGTI